MGKNFLLLFLSLLISHPSLGQRESCSSPLEEYVGDEDSCVLRVQELPPCEEDKIRFDGVCIPYQYWKDAKTEDPVNFKEKLRVRIHENMNQASPEEKARFARAQAEYVQMRAAAAVNAVRVNATIEEDEDGSPDESSTAATPAPAPEAVETSPTIEEVVSPIRDQEELEDKFTSFDADTCEWVQDMPRKIHEAPGCGRAKTTKICVGYVVCNRKEGEGKFIRASTCGDENCSDPVACTKDKHFWSSPASENDQKYLGRDIQNLINGASRQ